MALKLVFSNQHVEPAYQTHPQHIEFVKKYMKRLVEKAVVNDFE